MLKGCQKRYFFWQRYKNMNDKFAEKIILPYPPSKVGTIIHNNLLFIVQQNKIKVCIIEKELNAFEKRCINESLEYGLMLIDKKIKKGPFFTFKTGGEIFFHDFFFVCREDKSISCYLVI